MLPEPPEVARCMGCKRYFFIRDACAHAAVTESGQTAHTGPGVHARELSESALYEAIQEGLARDGTEELKLRLLAWRAGNHPLRSNQGAADRSCAMLLAKVGTAMGTISFLFYILHLPRLAVPFLCATPLALLGALITIHGAVQARRANAHALAARAQQDSPFWQNLYALETLLTPDSPANRLLKAEVARQCGRFDAALVLLRDEVPDDFRPAADLIWQLSQQGDRLPRRLRAMADSEPLHIVSRSRIDDIAR